MKKAIYLSLIVITIISCNTKEDPIVIGPNIIGRTYYGPSGYTSPLPGSTTDYYIGYKFISDTSVILFNSNYTPAVVVNGTVILPDKFVVTSKTTKKYKLSYPKITINPQAIKVEAWGEFITEDLLKISDINMVISDPSTKIGKFITDSIK